ncbi:MAG: hypothetical protein JXR94_10595 [Candidatus Hydrogenedentes bacterium]|nr:hypothetical protein [Candidatus Hydrogenedentota bacterium]
MASLLDAMTPLDYGRSFICHPSPVNSVRFWIESRTRIMDAKEGTSRDYYQCASCKSENTFAKRDLFKQDNYDFLPIVSGEYVLIFRRPVRLSDAYRSIRKASAVWGAPILKLAEAEKARELDSWEAMRDATAEATPIVTQTLLTNEETGLQAIIECPVKTMNISHDQRMYQVDTGPVALPDLSKRYDPEIDCLKLAFIALNAPDFADFVVEQPTALSEDGTGEPETYHYSKPLSVPALNRVLSLD